MKNRTAAAYMAATLLAGIISGAGQTLTIPVPDACWDMDAHTADYLRLQNDLVGAAADMADAPDPVTYAVHAAEADHLTASMEAVTPKYEAAKAKCLGGGE